MYCSLFWATLFPQARVASFLSLGVLHWLSGLCRSGRGHWLWEASPLRTWCFFLKVLTLLWSNCPYSIASALVSFTHLPPVIWPAHLEERAHDSPFFSIQHIFSKPWLNAKLFVRYILPPLVCSKTLLLQLSFFLSPVPLITPLCAEALPSVPKSAVVSLLLKKFPLHQVCI